MKIRTILAIAVFFSWGSVGKADILSCSTSSSDPEMACTGSWLGSWGGVVVSGSQSSELATIDALFTASEGGDPSFSAAGTSITNVSGSPWTSYTVVSTMFSDQSLPLASTSNPFTFQSPEANPADWTAKSPQTWSMSPLLHFPSARPRSTSRASGKSSIAGRR